MKNIEIKCPVLRFDAVRRALDALGAVRQTPVLQQVDWYFSVPHGRLKLRQANGGPGELLFYVRPSRRGRRLSVYGRSPVPDVSGMRSLLRTALGESACIRKSREVWLFRNARIHLNRVSRLGTFVEIEVEVRRGPRQARALMDMLISTLRLSPAASIGGSYADMKLVRFLRSTESS
ncbi:MAG: class IV adenylate cyclase [Acidobacteria bacterium]|nr:class IV adenylate cyclase [Acidobacteriota bacterium]